MPNSPKAQSTPPTAHSLNTSSPYQPFTPAHYHSQFPHQTISQISLLVQYLRPHRISQLYPPAHGHSCSSRHCQTKSSSINSTTWFWGLNSASRTSSATTRMPCIVLIFFFIFHLQYVEGRVVKP